MNEERIKEIFSDKEFVTELISLETPTDIQALLKTKGIDLDIDQIEKAKALVAKKLALAEAGEELNDDDLDEVSGGIAVLTVVSAVISIIGVASSVVITKTDGRW
ncbi:MAG: Nif11-like leader peptide family natural product precursor [Oscillospiraceae bacterium]|nr:Nif11-like leader peptide family natural product precursor [Oscillospiraceae bacterium]